VIEAPRTPLPTDEFQPPADYDFRHASPCHAIIDYNIDIDTTDIPSHRLRSRLSRAAQPAIVGPQASRHSIEIA